MQKKYNNGWICQLRPSLSPQSKEANQQDKSKELMIFVLGAWWDKKNNKSSDWNNKSDN